MAKSVLNAGLKQLRGKIDDWVYKVVRGKRVVARRPVPDPNRVPTPSELEARERFRSAAAYARSAMGDLVQRTRYQQLADERDKPIFALMIGDYYTPPTIHNIDLDDYHGQAGGKIRVRASDDGDVTGVTVKITDNVTHAVVETGAALLLGGDWVYTATAALTAGRAASIEVTAKDRPKNAATEVKVYP